MDNQIYAIGVDIGGSTTKFGLVSQTGTVSHIGSIPTKQYLTAEFFVDALFNALQPAINEVGFENIKGIGMGAPNGNYYTGSVDYAPNLPWKRRVPLAKMARDIFNLPCVLTNDANAAAAGEMLYGAARGMKDFIVITLGTGVGSGIVSNGQLVYGHDGFAGELGHVIVRRGRMHWATLKDGPLEAYVSGTGIALTARLLLETWDKPSLLKAHKIDDIDARVVCESALKGDELAKNVFAYTGEILGEALSNFVMYSSPEAIILFGGVIKAGDLLLSPTREHMEKNLLPIFQNKVKVLVSELTESNAAIIGASALVWDMDDDHAIPSAAAHKNDAVLVSTH